LRKELGDLDRKGSELQAKLNTNPLLLAVINYYFKFLITGIATPFYIGRVGGPNFELLSTKT